MSYGCDEDIDTQVKLASTNEVWVINVALYDIRLRLFLVSATTPSSVLLQLTVLPRWRLTHAQTIPC